jgi:hypothetical protein
LFFCLIKHAGNLCQAQAQSLPYLLTAGIQLEGLASIKVCGNEMVKALIENFGNFSLKILGIFVPYIIEDMDSRFHR